MLCLPLLFYFQDKPLVIELSEMPAEMLAGATGVGDQRRRSLDLAVVLPTFNERDNITLIIGRLASILEGLRWELIFVDDDSPDGTAGVIHSHAERDSRIRLVHRIGRRGLSSACVEGVMATAATFVAIMDADLQHDENALPKMLELLQSGSFDIVVGTRNDQGGSMGDFSKKRVWLSRTGSWMSKRVCRCDLTDPMSGFFILNRAFFLEVAPQLQDGGFKILLDIFASSRRPVRFAEVGYRFRKREHGRSKLDANTAIEFLFLMLNKITGGRIPARFLVFSLVGATGLLAHLFCLALLLSKFGVPFWLAQSLATVMAMSGNFFLNNLITYRDRSLRGSRLITGLLSFWLACSFGAWASVIFARSLLFSGIPWYGAGVAGVVLSSIWNYSISGLFTWRVPLKTRAGCH